MTIVEWRKFLQRWSEEWLARADSFPANVRKSRWLGAPPTTEKQILQLEKRLGYSLPSSYRNFLLTTNGWSRTSDFIEQVRPASKVQWLQTDDPQLLDAWPIETGDEPMGGASPAEYFAYDGRPIFDAAHLRECLIIADPVAGDSMIYLLNPRVVAEDGEWEAWRFAHWIPGAERFPSFELLMRAEHAIFLATHGPAQEQMLGPFEGPYAPDRPRHRAVPTGRGKLKPPPLTVPQLIAQLESPDRKLRLAAAKQLLRHFCPHDPANQRPELVGPLRRIIASQLEPDVRSAATAMLGSFGDDNAIPILIEALNDRVLTGIAVSAIFYRSTSKHDYRIGDAMVRLMGSSQDYFVLDHAINILEELKDARVAAIGLNLLDHAAAISLNIPPMADYATAMNFQRSSLLMRGAFAFARFGESAASILVTRCTHADPAVRAAAVAALRQCPDKVPYLIPQLEPLLGDPDSAVRQQTQMTLRFLEPRPDVKISQERLAEIVGQAERQLRRAASRKDNRF